MDIAPVGFTDGGLFHSLTYSAQPFYNKGRTTHFFSAQQKKHGGEEGIPNKSRYSRTPIT